MSSKKIGIVASTKEKAEQYAAKRFLLSDFWFYIPLGDTLTGRKLTHIIFDEMEDVEAKLKEKNT